MSSDPETFSSTLEAASTPPPRRARGPVRRSNRLSGAAPAKAAASSQGDETEQDSDASPDAGPSASDQSRSDTPMIPQDTLEEPSFALAAKVLHASDNPSPPPSPPPTPPVDSAEEEPVLIDFAPPFLESVVDHVSESDNIAGSVSHDFPLLLPTQPVLSSATEEDLISFDSLSSHTPTPMPLMAVLPPTAPSTPSRSQAAAHTVDDLLTLSPVPLIPTTTSHRLPSPFHDGILFSQTASRDPTPSGDEEEQVAAALSSGAYDLLSSPELCASNASNEEPLVILDQPNKAHSSELLHTPVRRSTRERRSVSPFVIPSSITKASRIADSSSHLSPVRQSLDPSPAQTRRKQMKLKQNSRGEIVSDSAADMLGTSCHSPIVVDSSPLVTPVVLPASEEHQTTPLPHEKSTALGKGKGRADQETHRLGSLSPTSTNALMQLLPPARAPSSDDSISIDAKDPTSTDLMTVQPSTLSAPDPLQPDVDPSSPCHDPNVYDRPNTPPPRPVDPGRTPARRVPIMEAISQGSVSPQKVSTFHAQPLGTPVFRARAPDDPLRSPAKRIPVSGVLSAFPSPQKHVPIFRFSSPLKSSQSQDSVPQSAHKAQRSSSTEPSLSQPGASKIGLFTRPDPAGSSVVAESKAGLAFASTSSRFPPTIPEGDESSSTGLPKSPAKPLPASSLRQPTARVESRIPRVGSKPYARPTAAATARTRLLISAPAKKPSSSIPTPAVARPLRIVPKVPSKPKPPVEVETSSTDNTLDVAIAGPGPRTIVNRSIASQPPVVTAENVTVTSLKRKREAEGSRTSPTGTRPVVLIRKVVSAPSNPKPSPLPIRIASPVKAGRNPATVQGRVQMRKAVGTKKSRSPATTTTPPAPSEAELEEPKDHPARTGEGAVVVADVATESNETAGSALPDSGAAVAVKAQSMPLVPSVSESTSSAEEAHAADAPQQSAEPLNPPPPPSIEVEPESSAAPLSSGLRRTTRSSRKSAEAATDVFGAVTCTTTTTTAAATTRRSSKTRGGRPTLLGPPDTSAFSSMSILALKSLTAANTERNQKQVAELQTEVVVKEGKRPDSPTTKVRTVLEKQKEEKSLEREKRAARRAQRLSQDAAGDASDDDGDGGNEEEEEEEEEEESVMSLDDEVHSNLTGHRRGPGDDEDYTTPERPERPLKRGRFETEELEKEEKNVKWDRGLSTTVWLDDSPPQPRITKDAAARKGCLAPSSKSLRLDTMGNVLNIESPLTLVVENITVKKFVYEGDAEEQEIPPEAPKMTRSKKKAKTS
ncbi:hypothetical protein PHLCEN_2v9439 [Hermanssonia centrifuga]|uniref:Uncharacterized protein n=1 Tax=Hermanssonia centrifuga TaxID=98765 RepID=A0A2R6NQP4_9APHY|nr:hypothetical protein PHLCEN_2v9439 [Hermanssonia centrifuga]